MTQDHLDPAAVARLTVDLVSAYCATLDIAPHELAGLVAYVGAVVGRPPARQELCPSELDPAHASPGHLSNAIAAARTPMQIAVGSSAPIISLSEYRARRAAIRPRADA